MKNKNVRGILALAVVTALSFGVIIGSKALATDVEGEGGSTTQEQVKEELDVSGAEHIEQAAKTDQGYVVTVKEKGYGGDILMKVSFDSEAKTITKVEVTEQSETENLGARIAEPEFLSQFEGVEAPVYLPGMSLEEESGETAENPLENAELKDGTYEVKADAADENGFTEQVTMTVKDGKITEVNWDSIGEDGTKKSVLAESGQYVMTEDGLNWKEQAEALADTLVKSQSLSAFTMDEQGKTDAVAGVSISIGSFVNLAEKCMYEAAGMEKEVSTPSNGTQVDAVSGATISSTAAVKGINAAYEYLQTVK